MNLAKTYEPQAYEGEIYDLWERGGAFEPQGSGEPFALIMPPPNANAALHIGTATFVKQDAKVRYERLKGRRTLYLPGADHAGFETWYVFEKELARQGKSKFDFSNHELYDMTWDFVQQNMHLAKSSYRQMGLSCSWDNFTFTLDEKITKNVKQVFKKMWEEGLVYRGKRLVNFCTFHGTSFSDIEVVYEDKDTPFYYLKYGPFELATTRPETIMGDTAVAFHPDDERYKHLEGQEIEIEGPERSFKVLAIADEAVDPGFGTGVVKVTPAHDFTDNEIAERHNLPLIEVIGKDGLMNENAGKYEGMTVLEAREAVVNDLRSKGLIIKIDENYRNRVGVCYKCHTVIEPLMMDQWFVAMQPLAKKAIEAIENDRVEFVPAKRKEIGLDYLRKIKDWNISRQCPWGIQIPAFYNEELDRWIYSDSDEDEVLEEGRRYLRDCDTFDTWMSSSQFPYLALGWPESEAYKEFFPTSWLHLGREIFTQWGLRMIMMSLYITDEVPFKTLYVNGNIRGTDGKKMSKSLGNNVAAKDILDEFGSDAMRIGMLMIDTTPSADKAYDPSKVVLGRNFTNKLWNVARFVENLLDMHKLKIDEAGGLQPKSPADHWILGELNKANIKVDKALANDNFGEAINTVYDVIWNKLADWYVEASKQDLNLSVLGQALEVSLKLAHPFAPFVTEAIWQSLEFRGKESMLVTESWPTELECDIKEAAKFEMVIKATEFMRRVKTYIGGEMEVSAPDDALAEQARRLARLKGGEDLTSSLGIPGLEGWNLMLSSGALALYKDEIGRRVDEIQAQIKNLEARLGNSSYIEKAPEKLVSESKEALRALKEELKDLKSE